MYDGIIFDIDGTLWNSSRACAKGWTNVLRDKGEDIRVTKEQIENVSGKPFNECIRAILPNLSEKYPNLAQEIDDAELLCVKNEGGDFYDGVPEEIQRLAESNKIFLVSNCQDWYIELFIRMSGLANVITDYNCYGMSLISKGEMLKGMKNKYNLNNPVYIGDTEWDEIASLEAGMGFIHAQYGFGKGKGENVLGFQSLKEIIEHLKLQT